MITQCNISLKNKNKIRGVDNVIFVNNFIYNFTMYLSDSDITYTVLRKSILTNEKISLERGNNFFAY